MYIFSGMDSKHNSKQKPCILKKVNNVFIYQHLMADLHEMELQIKVLSLKTCFS